MRESKTVYPNNYAKKINSQDCKIKERVKEIANYDTESVIRLNFDKLHQKKMRKP